MNHLLPQSCLILEVPEAEATVGQHREKLDASARLGVPTHFTVLFAFMTPKQIDVTVLTKLRHLFWSIAAFDFRLARTAWFGDDVLWLAPEDPEPIQALTALVHKAFPDHPPVQGHADAVTLMTQAEHSGTWTTKARFPLYFAS